MANAIATAYVQVIPSTDGIQGTLNKEFDEAGTKAGGSFSNSFSGFLKGAVVAGAVVAAGLAVKAMGDIAVESVKLASDFNETSAAIDQVFGSAAASLKDIAATAPKALGQTSTQFLDAAKSFGIFGKAAGLAEKDNAAFSAELVKLATDLASFNNTDVSVAIDAIGAGLRGESEPLRQFGVLLDDATLKARAMAMGIYDGTGTLTQQQRVLAAQAEILAQTSTQQGDFARTADGLANSNRTLTATWDEMQTKLGTALLPAVQAIIPEITAFIDQMVASPEFNLFLENLTQKFIDMTPNILDVLAGLGELMVDVIPVFIDMLPSLNDLFGLLSSVIGLVAGSATSANTPLSDLVTVIGNLAYFGDLAMTALGDLTASIAGDNVESSWLDLLSYMSPVTGQLKAIADYSDAARQMLDILNGKFDTNIEKINAFRNALRGLPGLGWIPEVYGVSGAQLQRRYPGQAEGGITTRSGLSWVGENGPELMQMPRGAQVIPLDRATGSGTVNYYAAPNQSIDAEQALFTALKRAKVLSAW